MKNKLYLSMGALVERRNGFDADEVVRTVPRLMSEGLLDGAEFMFIKTYYGEGTTLARRLVSEGVVFPTFHTDKDIGAVLSDAGVAAASGETESAKTLRAKAIDMFKYNCECALEAGSPRLVLHLWGGLSSDKAIDFNAEALPELADVARSFGLRIMVENVPSTETDPLTNWKKIKSCFGDVGLVFDTRFATCHRNAAETLGDGGVTPYIEHVHISDYRGGFKEFRCLRPVFHPGEGIADFDFIFSRLKELSYGGTFTLESPGITDEGPAVNYARLCESLKFIKKSFEI